MAKAIAGRVFSLRLPSYAGLRLRALDEFTNDNQARSDWSPSHWHESAKADHGQATGPPVK